MAKTYAQMDYEELEKENQILMGEKADLREKQLRVVEEMDKRVHVMRAESVAGTLNAEEREALAQVVNGAGGIESGEKH